MNSLLVLPAADVPQTLISRGGISGGGIVMTAIEPAAYLSAGLDALGQTEEGERPGRQHTAEQLPVDATEVLDARGQLESFIATA